ncbi:hypothetical protein HZH68_005156 [Vespula germanica]|uniref:Uncharacterized protein n=1 Tax=Vespula germanica TaxID=30212 RepID=A0A834KFR5_VESGE|nr:hypothetical protein HZH68_005156 [Vespula germanica]
MRKGKGDDDKEEEEEKEKDGDEEEAKKFAQPAGRRRDQRPEIVEELMLPVRDKSHASSSRVSRRNGHERSLSLPRASRLLSAKRIGAKVYPTKKRCVIEIHENPSNNNSSCWDVGSPRWGWVTLARF